MQRKIFSKVQHEKKSFPNTKAIILKLSDFDEYKKELVEQRNRGELSVGTFQNRSTAVNVFLENLLDVKGYPEGDEIVITASDVYKAFNNYIRKKRPLPHTLSVNIHYTKRALEHILLKKYNTFLSTTLGTEIFNIDIYLGNYSPSMMRTKATQLRSFKEKEKSKVISTERVKDGLRWLAILKQKRPQSLSVERLRLATLILLTTGARASEVNELQFEVIGPGGEKLKQIDLRRGIIYFHRKKLKRSDGTAFTPVIIHPILVEELKNFKQNYVLDPTTPIFNRYSLDKQFKAYFTPKLAFRKRKQLEELYDRYSWLTKYDPNKPILTVKMFRKYFDSFVQNQIIEIADGTKNNPAADIFGIGIQAFDNLRRYKNFLLGRAEGVDFLHYISLTEDRRYYSKLKKVNKMLIDELIMTLIPEVLYVLSGGTRSKFFGKDEVSDIQRNSEDYPRVLSNF